MTKKELIKLYENGNLKEKGIETLSNVFSIVVVDIDEREGKVFGYFSGLEFKDYFYVKLEENYSSFKVKNRTYNLKNFMRI